MYEHSCRGGGTSSLRMEKDKGVAIGTSSLQLPRQRRLCPWGDGTMGIEEVGGRVPPQEGQGVQQRC
jgi:hypothetical protein